MIRKIALNSDWTGISLVAMRDGVLLVGAATNIAAGTSAVVGGVTIWTATLDPVPAITRIPETCCRFALTSGTRSFESRIRSTPQANSRSRYGAGSLTFPNPEIPAASNAGGSGEDPANARAKSPMTRALRYTPHSMGLLAGPCISAMRWPSQ